MREKILEMSKRWSSHRYAVSDIEGTNAALDDLYERTKKTNRFPFLLLLLLLLLILLGYGIWIGVTNYWQDQKITDLQSTSLGSTVTVIQTGTFLWAVADPAITTGYPDNCIDSAHYLNDPQVGLESTYTLENVQVGLMNYTVIVLDPPPQTLVLAANQTFRVQICMLSFDPIIQILDQLGVNGAGGGSSLITINPFTQPNLDRLSIDSCDDCYVVPIEQFEARQPHDAYMIAADNVIDGNFNTVISYLYEQSGTFVAGTAITVTESLQLVLRSS